MSGKNTITSNGSGKEKLDFKAWWGALPPQRRKLFSMLAGIGVILLLAILITSGGSGPSNRRSDAARTQLQNALLPEEGGRELGLAGMSKEQQDLRSENRELKNSLERMQQQLDRIASNGGAQAQAERMQQDMDALRRQIEEMKQTSDRAAASARSSTAPTPNTPAVPGVAAPMPVQAAAPSEIRQIVATPPAGSTNAPSTGRSNADVLRERQQRDAQAETENYLPAGTMITGVLLTGLDAPTGRAAMRDPLPVLLRVKRDAVLPNRYRADYKECFVLLEAVGDLPSERAMMRANGMSCVRPDRSVIDVPMQGFAVGEDGKSGLRGTVVSKQGQAISKAMLAGFADGVSRAFGGQNQSVRLGEGELPSGGAIGASGVMGGASTALDRIAQHFLDLANQLHPVIEIDSGRSVTIVLTKGRTMAGRGENDGRGSSR